MEPDGPYRDPKEGERIHAERRREEARETAEFRAGLRRRRARVLFVGAALVLVAGGALAFWRSRTNVQVPPNDIFLASEVECKGLHAEYMHALPKRSCQADDECVAQARGDIWSSLDGCLRVLPRGASTGAADVLAEHWKGRGCAHSFRTCPLPRGAICEQGACTETPPPDAPRAWRRHEVPGVLVFFAPAGLTDNGQGDSEDSYVISFSSNDTSLKFDIYGMRDGVDADDSAVTSPPWGTEIEVAPFILGGFRGRVTRGRRPTGEYYAALHARGMSDDPGLRGPVVSISVNAACDTERQCDEAERMIRTSEPWMPRQ